jgi:hypothetical protein
MGSEAASCEFDLWRRVFDCGGKADHLLRGTCRKHTQVRHDLQYAQGSGYHGTDLVADFDHLDNLLSPYSLLHIDDGGCDMFAKRFQQYLISHARSSDSNQLRDAGTVEWPNCGDG